MFPIVVELRRTFVNTGRLLLLLIPVRYVTLFVKRKSSSDDAREGEDEPVEVVRSCRCVSIRETLGLFGGVSNPGEIDMAKPRPTERNIEKIFHFEKKPMTTSNEPPRGPNCRR